MQVEAIPLTEIKPYWRNPRVNDRAVGAVKESIERFGMNQPLVIDRERVIIAGHTRYRALRELGAETAPCVVVNLPPDKAKEYRLADNSTGDIAEWDMAALIPELREIGDLESVEVFFPKFDLADLLADTAGAGETAQAGVTQEKIDARSDAMDKQFED